MNTNRAFSIRIIGHDDGLVALLHDQLDERITREQFISRALAKVIKTKGENWISSYKVNVID